MIGLVSRLPVQARESVDQLQPGRLELVKGNMLEERELASQERKGRACKWCSPARKRDLVRVSG